MILINPGGGVDACAFSPDGNFIAAGANDGIVTIWSVIDGAQVTSLPPVDGRVKECAYSPDGRLFAVVSDYGMLKVWDAASWIAIGAGHGFRPFAFSNDSTQIVVNTGDGTPFVLDVQDRQIIATMPRHPFHPNALAYSPDDRQIISATGPNVNELMWHDSHSGLLLHKTQVAAPVAIPAAFSHGGRRLVAASSLKTLRVWDVETASEIASLVHSSLVESVAFSGDGRLIVSGCVDGSVHLWSADTGDELAVHLGHNKSVSVCTFSPDFKLMATGSTDRSVRVWPVGAPGAVPGETGPTDAITFCCFSPDSSLIASDSQGGSLTLWDGATGKELRSLRGHRYSIETCAFSPEGDWLVSGPSSLGIAVVSTDRETGNRIPADDAIRIWNVRTGEEAAPLAGSEYEYESRITVCRYSPDGNRIISAASDGTLRIWDALTKIEIAKLQAHEEAILDCAFSPDGRRIVSASEDQSLKIWDVETCTEMTTLTGHRSWVRACAFGPDGITVLSASRDETLRLWHATTGAPVLTLTGQDAVMPDGRSIHSAPLAVCAYSPDGKRIAAGSRRNSDDGIVQDGTIRIWELPIEETPVEILLGPVNALSFSPGGQFILSACDHGGVTLWDAANGLEAARFGIGLSVPSATFGQAGKLVAAGDAGAALCLLRLECVAIAPPFVTAVWLYSFRDRTWEKQPTVKCEWCGQRFPLQSKVLDVIRTIIVDAGLQPDDSPSATLPLETWDQPGLRSECPNCLQPLRFNPFIVDNRDLFPGTND